jgi:hypothetical protein
VAQFTSRGNLVGAYRADERRASIPFGVFSVELDQPPSEIYLLQPTPSPSDGITAGQVSKALEGLGLPANSALQTTASGFTVAGSRSGADVQFGVALTPDTSANIGVYFDLALNGYNIHVGFPASCGTSANTILGSIKSALKTPNSAVNQLVEAQIKKGVMANSPNLTEFQAAMLLAHVSIQFTSLVFSDPYSWSLSNQDDPTLVIHPELVIGYPRPAGLPGPPPM